MPPFRSAGGPHRCRPGRPAAHAPPARRARAPADGPHRGASSARGRAPRPNARAHIIHDGDLRAALAHPFRDGMRELRAVDNDERIRFEGQGRIDRLIDPPHELREPGEDRGRPYRLPHRTAEKSSATQRLPCARRRRPRTRKTSAPAFAFIASKQLAAEHVARVLARHHKNPLGLRHDANPFNRFAIRRFLALHGILTLQAAGCPLEEAHFQFESI